MRSPLWKYSLILSCVLAVLSGRAEAQECGDADGNGAVSVTDGVQTLRAAADLSSSCTLDACDVDGSGGITVTDGVNVLRKAAGLPITEKCPNRNARIESLLGSSLQIFGALTKARPAGARAAEALPCENDGTFEEFENSIFFDFCQLDDVIFDGVISAPSANVIEFDGLDLIDAATEDLLITVESGSISVRDVQGSLVLSGPLEVSTDDLDGFLSITFVDVTLDPAGIIVGGALELDVTDAGIEGVVAIRLGLTDATILPVTVIFDDQTTLDFTFDTVSGDLTQV